MILHAPILLLRLGGGVLAAGHLSAHADWVRFPARADRLRKPDLFLIGAMKSGTTYLNRLLGTHPAIFMCSPEEPSYFVDPEQLRRLWPAAWDAGLWRGEERYLRLFQPAESAVVLGEASTNYTKRPFVSGVPERIHRFNPDARFIYLVRDPVRRTISHYWHTVRFHAESRPMLQAIRSEPQYLAVSHYAMQIQPYLDIFGRDRIAVLSFEQLTAAPVQTMHRLFGWLGLDPAAAETARFGQPENATPNTLLMATGRATLPRLRQSRPFRLVAPYVPRALRRSLQRLVTRPVDRRSVSTADVVSYLRPIQRRQTEEFERLVGQAFPEWTTLYGQDVA